MPPPNTIILNKNTKNKIVTINKKNIKTNNTKKTQKTSVLVPVEEDVAVLHWGTALKYSLHASKEREGGGGREH
jgi:hypothetical protein